jgi:hypothetical protein
MKSSTHHPLSNAIRLLLMVAIVMTLTLGIGQSARAATSPAPVNLGAAAPFVILTKTGVTNISTSAITGHIGASPIAATGITGFSLIADPTNTFSKSSQVTGKIYAANYASPTPSNLTTAVSNMEAAYTDAAGRALPDFTELYSGNLSGQTLAPGLYKWGTGVSFTTNVTLAGTATDVWIFQIAGDLTIGSSAQVLLSGGAVPQNIFWQVGGGTGVEIGTTAHVEGNILAAKAIHLRTGASLNGRALSQTAVTLDQNTLVIPVFSNVGPTFNDVPLTHWAWSYIERLYSAGLTAGCSVNPLNYCPANTVTRAEMAVFLLRGIHYGSTYSPPDVGLTTGFTDVPITHWAAAWIKELAAEGITNGCGVGIYCPNAGVTRAEMAILLLRSKYTSTYSPPDVGLTTGFTDVPITHWAAAWIKQLALEGITNGCGVGTYCPTSTVTRAEIAAFLVRTFNLP